MAELYGPFDAGPGASFIEDDWYKLVRGMGEDGGIFQYATEITSPYVGPQFNAFNVTAAGGLDVSLGVGVMNVHGHKYENTTGKIITLEAAHATLARNDIIVARLDRTANTITGTYVKGTASASPVDPAMTRSPTIWEVPIARVLIPAASAVVGAITKIMPWAYEPIPANAYAEDDTNIVAFTNTAPTAGSPVVGDDFVVCSTGMVKVTMTAMLESLGPTTPVWTNFSFELRTGAVVGSGTLIKAADDSERSRIVLRCLEGVSANSISMSLVVRISGLTPGSTYNVRTMHWRSAATGDGTAKYRAILVEPVMKVPL